MVAEASKPASQLKVVIHDLAFDFHGRRMATCDSNEIVRIYEVTDDDQLIEKDYIRAHKAAVWKVTWAHPEFGSILATCSFDKYIHVWEEIAGDDNKTVWKQVDKRVDSYSFVTDIRFAPKHFGLCLASVNHSGTVFQYIPDDDCNSWKKLWDDDLKMSLSSVSWSQSSLHPQLLAVASDSNEALTKSKLIVYEKIKHNVKQSWKKLAYDFLLMHTAINDLCFAPDVGRSYQHLAVASAQLMIFTLKPVKSQNDDLVYRNIAPELLGDSKAPAWRVSWNVTGTVLAASYNDEHIRIFQNINCKWHVKKTIPPDASVPMQLTFQRELSASMNSKSTFKPV